MSSEIKDPGLWTRYVAFMKAALALIQKHRGSEPIATRPRAKVRREDRTTIQFQSKEEPDLFFWLAPLFDALQKLDEFQQLHRYILCSPLADQVFVDAGNKPIGESRSQSHWLMNFYMMPLLTRYIGPEPMLDFDEGRAKALYASLETSMQSTQAVYSVVAPLQHFEGPDEDVRLDAAMMLRKLSEDEMAYLWHLGEFSGIVDRSQVLHMSFCLATTYVTDKNAPTNLSEVRGHVMRAVAALRLLKSGQVGVPAVIQRLREPALGLPGGSAVTSGPSLASLGPAYSLLADDSEALITTYEALGAGAPRRELRMALHRFNYAYERSRPEDRLIDNWVALEALFLPDSSGELSFRASLRIAYYLAGSPDEREEVFHKMRLSYDTRSQVVHGEQLKADVREVASDTEEILRWALRTEVLNPGSLNVDRLNAAIVRGEGPRQEGVAK